MAGSQREKPSPLYPKLNARTAAAMGPKRVARHQRGRLMGAMVAAVDRRGYEAVSISELVALAGVSRTTFYQHFEDKQDCFLATFEEIVGQGAGQVEAAYRSATGTRGRPAAAFDAFLALATEQEAAARLVFLSSLDLGHAAGAVREASTRRFERMLGGSLAEAGDGTPPTPPTVRGVVGGAHEVLYRRLRDGKLKQLQTEIPALVDWALSYAAPPQKTPSEGQRLYAALTEAAGAGTLTPDSDGWDWEDSPKTRAARKALSQHDRILRGTAQVVAAKGYGALSVAAISGQAGVSNQTFYANFVSKEEATLAALDALALASLQRTAGAFRSEQEWLRAGTAGMVALLTHFARSPLHRQLVFREMAAVGPAALDRAEAMLDVFIGFLEPAELPAGASVRPPQVALEAIAGGLWAMIAREVTEGRGDSLPALAPELIDFVLVPFGIGGTET